MKHWVLLLLLSACAHSRNWHLDCIASGQKAFDSSRLLFSDANTSPMQLELVRLGSEIEGFILLSRHRFAPSSKNPPVIEAEFLVKGESIRASLPLRGGLMRLRLPSDLTDKLIQALQEGSKIDILLDGFEQEINPVGFNELYQKFNGSADRIANYIKGLF